MNLSDAIITHNTGSTWITCSFSTAGDDCPGWDLGRCLIATWPGFEPSNWHPELSGWTRWRWEEVGQSRPPRRRFDFGFGSGRWTQLTLVAGRREFESLFKSPSYETNKPKIAKCLFLFSKYYSTIFLRHGKFAF